MYLTKDDYFNKRGINLDIEFRSSRYDDPSNAVNLFLQQAEDFVCEYLETNYGTTRAMLEADPDNTIQKALIYQIDFILENGDLTNIDTLCNNAFRVLRNKGFCNLQTDGSKPQMRGWF